MHREHYRIRFDTRLHPATVALALAIAFSLTVAVPQPAPAQTYKVIYNFTGGADGATPMSGLVMDRGGKLYGTASAGGAGYGTVFKLTRSGSNWIFSPLYTFQGGTDGANPMGALAFGPDGSLYGATEFGGQSTNVCPSGCGSVYNLKPSPRWPISALSPWINTTLYRFSFSDGAFPLSEVIFDATGSLYGTTYGGSTSDCDGAPCSSCNSNCGVVYQLTHSNGSWSQNVLFQFNDDTGSNPSAGLVFDNAGSLYGVTPSGGSDGLGTLFQLTPSGSGWTERALHNFQGAEDGGSPYGTLIIDSTGLLYGGAPGNLVYHGTVFTVTSSGSFFFVPYVFPIGDGPYGSVTMDAQGNLYGTTTQGGTYGWGLVFKLAPSGGGWTFTDLHDFQGGSDGCGSKGKVLVDSAGNLFGTGPSCGSSGHGMIWEITP